jgi:hypothetical protein
MGKFKSGEAERSGKKKLIEIVLVREDGMEICSGNGVNLRKNVNDCV